MLIKKLAWFLLQFKCVFSKRKDSKNNDNKEIEVSYVFKTACGTD